MSESDKRSSTIAIRRGSKRTATARTEDTTDHATAPTRQVPTVSSPPEARSTPATTFEPVKRVPESAAHEKLAHAPLSVLLPRCGDVLKLQDFREELERRLANEGGQEATHERRMLQQALSWLSASGGRDV